MTLSTADLLDRLATTFRAEIGPAVDGDYPRTQAFMAAVVVQKLGRQTALAPDHERVDASERAQLFADLDALLPAERVPRDVRTVVDAGIEHHDHGPGTVCRMIEALYAHRPALGTALFDEALHRVRTTLRSAVDRRMEYAA